MGKIRGKNTAPELTVRSLVHRMGFRFRLHARGLPGTPDLVFARARKIIFVHGCFWHNHTGCKGVRLPKTRIEYWSNKLCRNAKRDRRNQRKLRTLGWKILTVWECQLRRPAVVRRKIEKFLERPN
jgi:DNA mismatch endonuclease (patch repair protein)